MSQADKDVRHDAASLYRFIDSVCSSCERRGDYPAYLEASREFIDHVCELGKATKKYLAEFPDKLENVSASDYNVTRQQLPSLRSSWFELHKRLKPASDADTLHLPYPLIRALVHRVQEIEDLKSTRFAVIHTEQLNYLQITASKVQEAANNIAEIVGYKELSRELGIIGIPYSQSTGLLLNCLIAHEFAHYAFDEKQVRTTLAPHLKSALSKAFPPGPPIPQVDYRFIPDVMAGWAEELFCDLFAVWLVGPSFSYAFIEIFGLTDDLDRSRDLRAAADHANFSYTHPAMLFRLQQQLALLETLGWWDEMVGLQSHYVHLLSLAKAFPKTQFSIRAFRQVQNNVLEAMSNLMPAILEAVTNIVGKVDTGLREYQELRTTMEQYFEQGIVPSSVIVEGRTGVLYPKPITVLNVAYQFYLEGLDRLINQLKEQDPLSVAHRAGWTQKVEMWTMKAIDDYLFLTGQKGV